MIDTVEPEIKKRSLRRHHNERMKNRTRRIFNRWGILDSGMEGMVNRCYNNITRCSCYMCGNRRKYNGISFQERKDVWSEKTYRQDIVADDWWFDLIHEDGKYDGYGWCELCDKEFIGVCSSCGCKG